MSQEGSETVSTSGKSVSRANEQKYKEEKEHNKNNAQVEEQAKISASS
jgi:hypothetical protein